MAAKDKEREIHEENEDLQEFDATGEKSSTADPVGGKTPKRKGDKENSEDDYYYQGGDKNKSKLKGDRSAPETMKSKASMVSDAVKLMQDMDDEDLQEFINRLNGDTVEEEVEDDEKVELQKITTDDVDVSEDIDAIFKNDDELSEDFKDKAKTVFETSVVSKVNEILENAYVDAYSDKESLAESVSQDLSEKLDDYLDYVVNEWVEDNQIAIDKGIRSDLAESFLGELKKVFEEHYVDIPEEKVDVVNELVEKNEELEENVNELTENNVELFKRVKEYEQERVVNELSEDLTESEKDKLKSLAEGISFKNIEDYEQKVSMIKENYFGGNSNHSYDATTLSESTDEIPLEEEKDMPANMSAYRNAISRHAKGTMK